MRRGPPGLRCAARRANAPKGRCAKPFLAGEWASDHGRSGPRKGARQSQAASLASIDNEKIMPSPKHSPVPLAPQEALGELLAALGLRRNLQTHADRLVAQLREANDDWRPRDLQAGGLQELRARALRIAFGDEEPQNEHALDPLLADGLDTLLALGVSREEIEAWAQPGSILPAALPALLGAKRSAREWGESELEEVNRCRLSFIEGNIAPIEDHSLKGRVCALALALRGIDAQSPQEERAAEWFGLSNSKNAQAAARVEAFGAWLLQDSRGACPAPIAFAAERGAGPSGTPDAARKDVLPAAHAQWVIEETEGLARLSASLMGAAWTEASKGEAALAALKDAATRRLAFPLSEVGERPDLERELPGWRPAAAAQQTRKEGGASPKADDARAQALEQGAIGRLAVAAADRYALRAPDGHGLVGEAKKALIEKGGWTPAAWRLAAASPELADACASLLAEQVKEAQNAVKAQRTAQARQDRRSQERKTATIGNGSGEGAAQAQALLERRQETREARTGVAVATLMRGVAERGATPERALALKELIGGLREGQKAFDVEGETDEAARGAALRSANRLAVKAKEVALPWLAGEASSRDWAHRRERMCRDLRANPFDSTLALARQALAAANCAPQFAAALVDGWIAIKGKEPTPSDARERMERELALLGDCMLKQEGFFEALPKKFDWNTLMRWQERWHEQVLEEQANTKTTAFSRSEHWPAVAADWASGEFEAVVLRDASELKEEGRAMRHCVGGYADTCLRGNSRIVSIRWRGARVSTLQLQARDRDGRALALPNKDSVAELGRALGQIERWENIQHRGPHNGHVRDALALAFCEEYVAKLPELCALEHQRRAAAAPASDQRGESERRSEERARAMAKEEMALAQTAESAAQRLGGLDGVREAIAKRRGAAQGNEDGAEKKPAARRRQA
jgi:hypothetical protein